MNKQIQYYLQYEYLQYLLMNVYNLNEFDIKYNTY